MITLDADTIGVHRLVQAVTRTPDPTDPHRQPTDITHARDTATAALAATLAGADYRLPACGQLAGQPHDIPPANPLANPAYSRMTAA